MRSLYIPFFESEESINPQAQIDFESKQAKKLIKWLKDTRANNYDNRLEFAKVIFQLCLSYDKDARKLIKKISQFISYYETDEYISQDEWNKLNNFEESTLKESLAVWEVEGVFGNKQVKMGLFSTRDKARDSFIRDLSSWRNIVEDIKNEIWEFIGHLKDKYTPNKIIINKLEVK